MSLEYNIPPECRYDLRRAGVVLGPPSPNRSQIVFPSLRRVVGLLGGGHGRSPGPFQRSSHILNVGSYVGWPDIDIYFIGGACSSLRLHSSSFRQFDGDLDKQWIDKPKKSFRARFEWAFESFGIEIQSVSVLEATYLQNHHNPVETLQNLERTRLFDVLGAEEIANRIQLEDDLLEPQLVRFGERKTTTH